MEPAGHLVTFAADAAALAAAARLEAGTPIPSCPEWTLAELVEHTGRTHQWATAAVVSDSVDRPDFDAVTTGPGPDEDLARWYEMSAARLVDALKTAGPKKPAWTFSPNDRTATFWYRRQANEVAVHRWDAENAVGPPAPISAERAVDALDEWFDDLLPRALKRLPGSWSGETLHVHRTDGEGEWFLRLGPEGKVVVERGHQKGDLAVRGAASDLVLWAMNRLPASSERLELFGDAAIADRWAAELKF
jgi:uncharacterized protein (TIGR03083 family)